MSFDSFAEDYVLRRMAEHAVLIISEAVKALSPSFTDHYPGVDWHAVRNVGNVLRHEYFEVDTKVLWRIVTKRLPELKPVIDLMIERQTN